MTSSKADLSFAPGTRARRILFAQGVMYVVTGAWPLFHMPSFEQVAGPKTDDWLVCMVGLLAVTIGLTLLFALRRRTVPREVILLATLSAASFTAIDLVHAIPGRISRIYLADAAIELIYIANGLQMIRKIR